MLLGWEEMKMEKKRPTGYGVITGASAGLGEEFARQLARKGYPLVLIARREDRLRALSKTLGVACEIIAADLSDLTACQRVLDGLRDKPVAVFINNAGFGDCGSFAETELSKELNMIDLNIKAMHYLMKGMLRKMQAQGRGAILNVASSAGLLPAGPYMSTYYATKAYVTSLTRGVAEELRQAKSPIYVGCLCPGPVDTEFNQVANVQFALSGISAQRCVWEALDKMERGKGTIIPTGVIKGVTLAGRLLPGSVMVKMISAQQKRKLSGKS